MGNFASHLRWWEGKRLFLYQWPFENGKIWNSKSYVGQTHHDTQFWYIAPCLKIEHHWTVYHRKRVPARRRVGNLTDAWEDAKPTCPYMSNILNIRFDEHVQFMRSMYNGGCSIAMLDYQKGTCTYLVHFSNYRYLTSHLGVFRFCSMFFAQCNEEYNQQ